MLRPGATGMRISGTLQAEDLVELVVEPEPLVLARRIPALELHDQLDALRRPRRRDAEQVLDVDDAEPAQLHVVPRQLRAGADQDRLGAAPDFDRVVGDQPVAADDQVERALALADAALADDQHAEAEDVHQHGVHASCARRASPRASTSSLAIAVGVATAVLQQRQPRALGFDEQLRRRREAAGDEHAREIERQREAQRRRRARPASRLSR